MTVNELLDALREAEEGVEIPDAYTMVELRDRTGRGENWLRARLHAAVEAGTVEPVHVLRTNIFGVTKMTPAYRFRKAA